MADEIRVNNSLEITNGNFILPRFGGAVKVTQTVAGGGVPGTIIAATAGSDVVTTAITTLGWTFIKNLDPTNYVEWGPLVSATFHPIGRLEPGEQIAIRLSPGKTLHIKADTAACKVLVLVNED